MRFEMNRLAAPSAFFASIVLLAAAGCRRTDVREMTVSIPGLSQTNMSVVVQSLAKYDGVKKDSFVWDVSAKTLTLKYDSMKIAQSNIRYAIDESGVAVEFPKKTDDRAGH